MNHGVKAAAVGVVIAVWFLAHTGPGLLAFFQGDDAMNMYRAWELPVWKLAVANLTPFTPVYRPAGAAFYRVMYELAGFHPRPFRIACYVLLLMNIWLAYRFAKLLTGSTEIAVLAAFLASWHKHLIDLYQNGGTIYDILCYTFFYGALCVYLNARQRNRALDRREMAAFVALSILALNSKEMAFTLPAAVWMYELLYHPVHSRRWFTAAALSAAALIAVGVKTGAQGAFAGNADYAVSLSADRYLANARSWLAQLFYLPETTLTATGAVLILVAFCTVALLSRRKHLMFCAAMALILPLPVAFIPLRNFFVMYIPLVAWATFIAAILVEARERLWPAIRPREPAQIGLFLLTAGVLWGASAHDTSRSFEWVDPSQPAIRELRRGLSEGCGTLPKDGSVLLRGDPFEAGVWDPVFVARLYRGSFGVSVDRTKNAIERPAFDYDCVLDYDGARFKPAAR